MTENIETKTTARPAVGLALPAELPSFLAIAYAFGGYGAGLYLLSGSGLAWVAGVLLLAHALVIAAYLLHECCHQSLFAHRPGRADPHRLLGLALSWLTGACYGSYDAIRDKHLRHHFERADIVALDYRLLLARRPRLRRVVEAGEWLCLPAVEILMHLLVMARPFSTGDRRGQRRVLWVLAVRAALFALLGAVGGIALLAGYAVAWLLFLSVLGLMDAFQHQYLVLEGLDGARAESPTRDRARFPTGYFSRDYEEAHTFSNLLSRRWPLFNLLVLNFCYHNAHHRSPRQPWYRLPALHRQHYGNDDRRVVPLAVQLRSHFRQRVARVMAPAQDRLDGDNTGAAGVSFLTPL